MLETFTQQLIEHGLRPTPSRRALLNYLSRAETPLSVPEILMRFKQDRKAINKTTVYRILMLLEATGLVERVSMSDRMQHFELTTSGHHHHLVCQVCEHVYDIPIDDSSLLGRVEQASRRLKFSIERHSLEFYGLCQACQ